MAGWDGGLGVRGVGWAAGWGWAGLGVGGCGVREGDQEVPVLLDEGLFFGAGPPFYSPLRFQGLDPGRELLSVNHLHGPAGAGVPREVSGFMGGNAVFQVVGVACVVGAVDTLQYVDVKGHVFLRSGHAHDTGLVGPSTSPSRTSGQALREPQGRPFENLRTGPSRTSGQALREPQGERKKDKKG